MRYVITGAAGHISKPLAENLIRAGHKITVIGRSPDHLGSLVGSGAEAAIGTVENVDFLNRTFEGADAVYTMVSPPFNTTDLNGYEQQIGINYANAIRH